MNFQFSGTHGCFAHGCKNGAYIKLSDTVLFIDVAAENLDVLEAQGLFNHPKLHVLLTHLHPDHVSGLPQMILKTKILYPPQGENKVIVLAPPGLHTDITELLRIQGCANKYTLLDVTKAPEMLGLQISPLKTKHSSELLSFGYLFNDSIYYSGDAKVFPEGLLNDFLQEKVKYMYQDTSGAETSPGHMTLTELEGLIPMDHRGRVTCMHFDTEDVTERAKNAGFNVAIKI